MADDQLEDWIIQSDLKKERRSRIVPASTDRLASEDPGDGEAAMEAVAAWLSTEPDLPQVELAKLSPRGVVIDFAEDTILPEPWVSELGEPRREHDRWGITHQESFALPRGEQYGWQVSGLTGLGTLADGSRGLINTCRAEFLQFAGTEEWARNLMITQVMSQAAEPWSADHDIWMIGFGETAEKLSSFLSGQHPLHRFRTADALTEISALDLKGTTATLYVMGSGPETETQFKALQVSGIGLVTDNIVTDKAVFLSEREGGVAVIGPYERDYEIWPNLRDDLIEKMEQTWQVNEELARQKVAAADFSELLESPEEIAGPEEKTPEEIKADFEALMAQSNFIDGSTSNHSGSEATEPTGEPASEGATDAATAQASVDESTSEEGDTLAAAQIRTDSAQNPTTVSESEVSDASIAPDAGNRSIGSLRLTVLGTVSATTPEGELTGRHAAALVILELTNEPIPAQQISEALWPGDDAEGHTARTRRSRLLSKLRAHVGDIVTIGDEGWSIEPGHITTDYDEVIDVLANEPIDHVEAISEACLRIARPLDGCEGWADYYRAQVVDTLTEALTDLKTRAEDVEAFDLVKAAEAASNALGEE